MIRQRLLRLALTLLAAATSACAAAGPQAKPRDAFFTYLTGKPEPALIAYSPTNHDPRDGKHRKIPSAESIRADLEALRPAFDGLILYGYDKTTTPIILAEAKRQKYRAVLCGIWDPRLDEEIQGTAKLVREYAGDLALAVAVGNEGINFNRYQEEDVTAGAEKLKKLLGEEFMVPLTTSEPLSQYGVAFVQEFGSFLTPNIHPVFDQKTLGAQEASDWARARAIDLATALRKPLLLKETGFPHGGDERFSPGAQREFWESYLEKGRLTWISKEERVWVSFASAFEAYDLGWKVQQSNIPIEGSWGLLSAERKPYPAFELFRQQAALATGPVTKGHPRVSIASRAESAYQFLCAEMDRWTDGTVVYDDRASGGAGFYPTNWVGDASALALDEGSTENSVFGTAIKLTFNPREGKGYGGIYWVYPDVPGGNWGNARGRDLVGATRLRGQIRGKRGGEVVMLRVGGINCPPHFNPDKPFRDLFGPVPQDGVTTLTTDWQPFEIAVPRGSPLRGVIGGLAVLIDAAQNREGPIELFLDDVAYDNPDKGVLRLIRSYVPTADAKDDPIRNGAFLYDNDLAILAFLARRDAEGDRRARILADTIVELQRHDRFYKDGRLRNAYACGPVMDVATNTARLPGIYDPGAKRVSEDRYAVSSDTGNMAWTIIALIAAHERLEAGKTEDYTYLRAAVRAGLWIEENCRVDDRLGGYSGGFEGWEPSKENPHGPKKLEWRSVEHNIDHAVACSQLGRAIARAKKENPAAWVGQKDAVWGERSAHALKFVRAMWNPEKHHLYVGTRDKEGTINRDAVAADAQTWSLLALGHLPEYRALIGWDGPPTLPLPLAWVEERCRRDEAGLPGYSFSAEGKGIWPEGCAHLAMSYHYVGAKDRAEKILREIIAVSPEGESGSKGILAAYPELAETGFLKEFAPGVVGPWTYPRRPHVGASAWFIMASLGANPYWLDGPPKP